MLDKYFIRRFNEEECIEEIENIKRLQLLTTERLRRLEVTKAKNPGWAAYDKFADDIVGIDIRIEEQSAVSEMFEGTLELVNLRLDVIHGIEAVFGDTPTLRAPAYQLGFFDTDKKRARMGVPC